MKLSHLNGLRALEATLRTGTFSAAADELGVTVAAVGQQIRGLEAYLGRKLFDRLPSGARPTTSALTIATRLTTGFAQIDEVLSELAGMRSATRLKIAATHFILDDWLGSRLPEFHRLHPQIEIIWDVGDTFVDLFHSDIDLAIRFSAEPGPEFEFDGLHKSRFMPVCTPDFARIHGLGPETRDLTGVPLYQIRDATTDPAWVGWPILLKRFGMTKGDRGPIQQVSSHEVALSGAALVLSGLTESLNDLRQGRLVAPFGPGFVFPSTYRYRLIRPAGRSLTRAMRQFQTWIKQERDLLLADAKTVLGIDLI